MINILPLFLMETFRLVPMSILYSQIYCSSTSCSYSQYLFLLSHVANNSINFFMLTSMETHVSIILYLNPYYMDTRGLIPPSNKEHLIPRINLLPLLVQNRIIEFYTKLMELLSLRELKNPWIKHVVELETHHSLIMFSVLEK